MNKNALLIAALGLLSLPAFAQQKKPVKGKPIVKVNPLIRTKTDTVSYGIGQDIGNTLKTQGFDSLNYDLLIKAIKDAVKGSTPLVTKEQCNASISDYLQKIKLPENSSWPRIKQNPVLPPYQVVYSM